MKIRCLKNKKLYYTIFYKNNIFFNRNTELTELLVFTLK